MQGCLRASPTCAEDAAIDCKRLHPEVEREDVEVAVNAEVLLVVAHVGAAEGRLPQVQAGVAPRKHRTCK